MPGRNCQAQMNAAELERLTRERAALRDTLVRFWARIGKTEAQ
jgi:hypothetical protein